MSENTRFKSRLIDTHRIMLNVSPCVFDALQRSETLKEKLVVKHLVMRFPGDPECDAIVLSRAEFLQIFPRQPIRIYSASGVESIPMGEDDIQCDLCSDDPGDTVVVVRSSRAYCPKCAEEWIFPYCTEVE